MKNPQIGRKETSQSFDQNAESCDFWDQPKDRKLINHLNYKYNYEKLYKNNCHWRCRKFKQGCKVRAISRYVNQ